MGNDKLFNGGDPNLYGYVQNDPINWNDPWGLINLEIDGASGELSLHANPGRDVVGENARAEHSPAHVHLGNNEGPRISNSRPFEKSCIINIL